VKRLNGDFFVKITNCKYAILIQSGDTDVCELQDAPANAEPNGDNFLFRCCDVRPEIQNGRGFEDRGGAGTPNQSPVKFYIIFKYKRRRRAGISGGEKKRGKNGGGKTGGGVTWLKTLLVFVFSPLELGALTLIIRADSPPRFFRKF